MTATFFTVTVCGPLPHDHGKIKFELNLELRHYSKNIMRFKNQSAETNNKNYLKLDYSAFCDAVKVVVTSRMNQK